MCLYFVQHILVLKYWTTYMRSAREAQLELKLLTDVNEIIIVRWINPLAPVPPVTARAKTTPEIPVPPVTARKKHMVTNALSVPPWRLFGSPIVLLIIRANKPIRICFLRIFLENSRGPRKKVFRLDSCVQNVQENHGGSPLLFTNFQGLVFHSEHRIFPLWG